MAWIAPLHHSQLHHGVISNRHFGGVNGIAAPGRLTVLAGTTLLFDNNLGPYGNYSLAVAGTLSLIGSRTQPISLTSASPASAWGGLSLGPTSHVSLSYVQMASTAPSDTALAALYVDGSSPVLTHVRFHPSQTNENLIVVGKTGGRPLIHECQFATMGYGVLSLAPAGTSAIDATLNWWGAPSGPSGTGKGTDAQVSAGVRYVPWLTSVP